MYGKMAAEDSCLPAPKVFSEMKTRTYAPAYKKAFTFTAIYILLASLWITFGDRILDYIPAEIFKASLLAQYESWGFIIFTALYILFTFQQGYRSLLKQDGGELEKVSRNLVRDSKVLDALIKVNLRAVKGEASTPLRISKFRAQTLSAIYSSMMRSGQTDRVPFHDVIVYLRNNTFRGVDLFCDRLELPLPQAVTLGFLISEILAPFKPEQTGRQFPVDMVIKGGSDSPVSVCFRFAKAEDPILRRMQNPSASIEGKLIDNLSSRLQGKGDWKKEGGKPVYRIRFSSKSPS